MHLEAIDYIMKEIWFWQLTISPHMVYVAKELDRKGYKVNFVARQALTEKRKKMGWDTKNLSNINIFILNHDDEYKDIINDLGNNCIHIVQGIRGNGYITNLIKIFKNNNTKFWVVMETVNQIGMFGFLKNIEYSRLFFKYKKNISGVLAIGYKTPSWLNSIGVANDKIYPFSYFLEPSVLVDKNNEKDELFRFIFVGSLIDIKRPNLVVESCSKIIDKNKIHIQFIGDGILKDNIQDLSNKFQLNVEFLGNIPIDRVRQYLAKADCLILPSLHDGWGAVTTEAMIEGTPVICSDACGSALTVLKSNMGGVFKFDELKELDNLVLKQFELGKISTQRRNSLKKWAKCLDSKSGANYLSNIIFETTKSKDAPWEFEK